MDVSIIIVNYNSSLLIINSIETIYRQTSKLKFEIIVVDNNSNDGGEGLIKKKFAEIQWINMNYNAGFARANNAGILHSHGEIILLLNPDTLVVNNTIERCYYSFINSKFIACGVQLLNPDNTPQISGNYAMTGGLNYLLPLPYLGGVIKFVGSIFKVKKPNVPDAKDTVEVDWINGAFLMVKKSAIKIAGLLDEDFFLYAEEAEWCGRLKKAGPLCIYGNYNIVHLQGETANETFGSKGKGYYNLFDKKGKQIMLSNLVRIRKQFGTGWFLFILIIYCVEIPFFFFGYFISKLFFKTNYTINDLKGFAGNVGYLLKLSPTIIANKPFFYKT